MPSTPAAIGRPGWTMHAMQVLLIDDDRAFADVLGAGLRRHGYDVTHVTTAGDALVASAGDLVLLDANLPDGDGLDVCRELRRRGDVAIIMVTARGAQADRVAGLRSGADDYVVKPFGFAELRARMEAILRRKRPRDTGTRTVGRLRLDLDRHAAYIGSEPLALTRKEFDLLLLLMSTPERPVSRERMLSEVWHTTWRGTSRTVGAAAEIQTIRGVGYQIVGGA
jgi:DNA-binding response OmpR family regulator